MRGVVMCHQWKIMQRLVVSQVKSICTSVGQYKAGHDLMRGDADVHVAHWLVWGVVHAAVVHAWLYC